MKKTFCFLLVAIMIIYLLPCQIFADSADFLIGDWSTSDGVYLSFYDDGYYEIQWYSFPTEEGEWYAETITEDTLYIEMEGTTVLSLMSMFYGALLSDYHFEVLKCNNDNFYLVQVQGDETAKSSSCKLGFTRDGAKADFGYAREPEKKDFQHIINSHADESNNQQFTFKKNEEFEDLLFSLDWGQYNPRLAHFLGVMSKAAYDESILVSDYKELGFTDVKGDYEKSSYARYKMGRKTLNDGRLLYLVTIQGSDSIFDNLDQWVVNSDYDTTPENWHGGFFRSAQRIKRAILEDLNGNIDDNTIFIITGHSLGAAAGNLLSIMLYECGIPKENLYDYNYACSNVAVGHANDSSYWLGDGKYSNIFNIEHKWDWVTCVPTNDWFNFSDWRWKRYGQSLWFDANLAFAIDKKNAHEMTTYIDYLKYEYPLSHFISGEYIVKAISKRCPVDVTVYNGSGEQIAAVHSGITDYFGNTPGAYSLIITNDDDDIICFPNSDDLDIRLEATDGGNMDFSIGYVDLIGGTVVDRKDFNSVELYSGKTMCCRFEDNFAASDINLYVVDENDNITAEINEDGTEVPVNGNESPPPARDDESSDNAERTASVNNETEAVTMSKTVFIIIITATVLLLIAVIAVVIVLIGKKNRK